MNLKLSIIRPLNKQISPVSELQKLYLLSKLDFVLCYCRGAQESCDLYDC